MITCRIFVIVFVASATTTLALGQELEPEFEREPGRGHVRVGCVTCHSAHKAKGNLLFSLEPNSVAVNPKTKEKHTGVSAICLACHSEEDEGGLGMVPVMLNHTHPYGADADPKVATVPEEFLRDGKLECVGCHDPHDSNPNYMLLRVDTQQGKRMEVFCAMCHPSKAHPTDLEEVKSVQIFDSMDETKLQAVGRPAAPPAAAPPVDTPPADAPRQEPVVPANKE